MAWPPTTHQDVEDDLTNGHGWATSLIERFNTGELGRATGFPWVAGRYYSSALTGTPPAGGTATADSMQLTPIYFSQARAVDQIACNVFTAGTAGHVARLGIYNSSSTTGLPTTVRVDAGTVAVSTAGDKVLTISTTLHGLFWLAITVQSGSFMQNPVASMPALSGALNIGVAGSGTSLIRSATVATSALPDMTGVTPAYGTSAPNRVVLRAA